MAKVILLSGSPNAEGNTVQVLRECAKTIKADGIETEIFFARRNKTARCYGL
jgi:multimeric flavodoxin WrbA